jgi:hypothetical protein
MILNEPAKTIETKGGNCYAILNEKAGRVISFGHCVIWFASSLLGHERPFLFRLDPF